MGAWKYEVIHDYNATKLIKEFSEENLKLKNSKGTDDDEIDFIVYAEKDDFTISLGRVLLIKMSDAMLKYYYQYKGTEDLTKFWAKYVYSQHKNNNTFHFKEDEIAKAFIESIKLQTKLISDISVLDAENFIKRITENISTFLHEDLKFSREQWDPTLKSDKYLFTKPEDAVKYFVTKCDNLIKELNEYKAKLELIKSFNIVGFEFKTPLIEDLIKAIDNKIKSIQKFKAWIIENKNDLKLKIPYICGVWNGTVEFIAGIIDIVLLALNIIISELLEDGINLETLQIREGIEEILEAILKDPMKIIDDAINSIKQYKYSRYDDPELNQYQLQYNEGEDTILAIDIIVTIITIIKGIAKLTKQLPKFTKWIDEVLARRKRKKTLDSINRLEKGWKRGWTKEKVLEEPKGSRDNPKEYLKGEYIKEHYELFQKEGIASRVVSKRDFEDFGIGKPDLEKTEFASRKSDIDDILMLSTEEQAIKLGKPIKQIENGELVRIDFKITKDSKIEIPTGNEYGTNEKWLPGGVLPDGNLEIIIKTEGLKEGIHCTIKYLNK
ncbi:hypothetical protein [Flavobacterium sp.]|uniref:hypothetical protein n=1 Tax=Flavobacterium sp. TaxID=239 RepID=UPI00286DA728|nr:hypothetical protein [Flavobacterium sp.]